ncbi:MAG: OmpA family protein [Nitrospira sp.]|nr:OmpA family protein [Nitrospira sp.]
MDEELFKPQGMPDDPLIPAAGMTDLMTSLAVVCLLLFVAQVASAVKEPVPVSGGKSSVIDQLSWQMESDHLTILRPDDPQLLTVVVPSPLLNFEFGKSVLSPQAENILSEIMPRYAAVLCGSHSDEVAAFVIEGHADDRGDDLFNLKLSQQRALTVLARALVVIHDRLPWAYECFLRKASASGRGSQDPIFNAAGFPDREKSRRVIFKLYHRAGKSNLVY